MNSQAYQCSNGHAFNSHSLPLTCLQPGCASRMVFPSAAPTPAPPSASAAPAPAIIAPAAPSEPADPPRANRAGLKAVMILLSLFFAPGGLIAGLVMQGDTDPVISRIGRLTTRISCVVLALAVAGWIILFREISEFLR